MKPIWVMCCWCKLCNPKPWNMHCRDESFYQFECQRFADYWTTWSTQWLQAILLNGFILNGFIPQIPPIKTKRINYDPVLGLCNSTQRNLSARSSIKTRRINYDPVLKLYYYKSIWEPDPRTKKRTTTLQESMGARGVQTLDANFDKSFVTPVWNFEVVSPGTIFWNNWGGNDPPIKAKWINYDLVLGLCNSTQRIYPPDRP